MYWNAFPFLRITPALVAGILLNKVFPCSQGERYFLLLFIIILFSYYLYNVIQSKHGFQKTSIGFSGLILFVLLGYYSAHITYLTNRPSFSLANSKSISYYTLSIQSKPQTTQNSIRYEALIDHIKIKGAWHSASDKLSLYMDKNHPIQFVYGDKLMIKGFPNYMKKQTNPHAFDYTQYLNRKGVFVNDYLEMDDYIHVSNHKEYSLKFYLHRIGSYFDNILTKFLAEEREQNIAKAMVIGQRDEITSEMKHVYQSTGTSHILAVSGLHVGIIYLVFSSIFKFLKRSHFRWIYYSLMFFTLWSYAIITGLSPSVIRASTMLSFILLAEMSKRNSNIYNTVIASAFFILLIAPNLIYSVSFQLSYMAVLGIIYLYHKIYRLIFIKSISIDFFWKITAISFSVQIATFSITIFYFNQFPTIFPITNLIAIPTATIVIVGSIGLFLTSFLPLIPSIIGYVLQIWISLYNTIMVYFSDFPFTVVEDIYLKPAHVFLLIISVFLLLRFTETKKLSYFRFFTLSILFLCVFVLYGQYHKINQSEIIFYDITGKNYFDVIIGENCYSNIQEPEGDVGDDIYFNILPNRRHHSISTVQDLANNELAKKIGNNWLIYLNNKSILVCNDFKSLAISNPELRFDYVVIGKSSVPNIEHISSSYHSKNLILNSTITNKLADAMENKTFVNSKIHSISNDGAYVIDF